MTSEKKRIKGEAEETESQFRTEALITEHTVT